ncbi:MAG: sensor histidine kinase [Chloroflexota bacterium]
MSQSAFSFRIDQLLRVALMLWVVYFSLLALVDWWMVDRDTDVLLYYTVQIMNSLFILGLTLLPWPRIWQKQAMLPIALALMAILPTVTVHIMQHIASSEPLRSPDGMTLRLTPILLMGLLLTAWHYRWSAVLLFSLGVTVVNLVGIFLPPIVDGVIPRFYSRAVLIMGIQTISLLIVGYMISALMSRLRLQQRLLEEANARLRDHASTQIELTISHERNRMARELHDTLAHTLSGLVVQLQTIKAYRDIEPATSQKLLDDALVATRDGLQETRGALKALRATPLQDLGLPLALRQFAEEAAARANLDLRLAITEPLPSFAPEIGHALYRVAQEAIMNVVYHADATTLSVHVTATAQGIQLTVVDDGSGFDADSTPPNHWGIEGMHERAQLVDGYLCITSKAGGGTTIQLTVPENTS